MTQFAAAADLPPTRRLGVLDVGSNTVHLLLVDAHWGARPTPVTSQRWTLLLAEMIGADGILGAKGTTDVVTAVTAAATSAKAMGCDELIAFATSAIRDASDSEDVLAAVAAATGIALHVLSGADEARLTFLAVRRWFGWSSGNLLMLDIGGGSLEIAGGTDEQPAFAQSLPLGAGRLYRSWFAAPAFGGSVGRPPGAAAVDELHAHVVSELATVADELVAAGPFGRVVGTSKTFRTLARLAGAAPNEAGPLVPRSLTVAALKQVTAFISRMTPTDVGALDGVSEDRSDQLVAGAAVALAAMEMVEGAFGVDRIDICPWALREGVILERLDQIAFES
jgi:exopolyphosphatase/guanosine-5'-triphosphate,3'-diphosphate pyrophosphatase